MEFRRICQSQLMSRRSLRWPLWPFCGTDHVVWVELERKRDPTVAIEPPRKIHADPPLPATSIRQHFELPFRQPYGMHLKTSPPRIGHHKQGSDFRMRLAIA